MPGVCLLITTAALCTTAEPSGDDQLSGGTGDPTELALLRAAAGIGMPVDPAVRAASRRAVFRFDPHLKRMSTIDEEATGVVIHTKGAPEAVLGCCTTQLDTAGEARPLDDTVRRQLQQTMDRYAVGGLRVLAVARRVLMSGECAPGNRSDAESGLTLLGLIGMTDPPRPGVAKAVAAAHRAGMRIHVITGDYGPTAAEVARQVGIGGDGARIITGADLEHLGDRDLDTMLTTGDEIIFARSSPEAKLRICEALHAEGQIVAMTGDGVNDAPALHHADIGVAMGRSGTDVAREAATMVLTDDNFATIVTAVEAGRRVFDNVRKFVFYIFVHAVPEVVPFLVFALSGGAIPLPMTVMQILSIDLGTDTFPALVLVMGGFLYTLWSAGWHPGDPTGAGTPLHHAYQQATTITFAGIVACQIGTAFAARTEHASLFTIGVLSNPLLLRGIAFEIAFAAALIYTPFLHPVFGTAALSPSQLVILVPFPFVIWGADECARWLRRRRTGGDMPA